MLYATLLVALAGVALGQEKCCTPDVWEGVVLSVTGGVDQGVPQWYLTADTVHYDHRNKRWAMFHRVEFGDESTESFRVIGDHKKEKMYVVRENECTESHLAGAMEKYCIPETAVYKGDYYHGIGDNKLTLNLWETDIKVEDKSVGTEWMSVTRQHCIPVETMSMEKRAEVEGRLRSTSLFDIRPSIADESVFTPPEDCKPATSSDLPKFVTDADAFHVMKRYI